MGDGTILRMFAFRPARSDSVFDAKLRDDVLPGLLAMSGLVDAFVDRHGPGEEQERIIASVWRSRQPIATRHAHRLVAGEVDHYELLPNTVRPPLRAREGARAAAGAARADGAARAAGAAK